MANLGYFIDRQGRLGRDPRFTDLVENWRAVNSINTSYESEHRPAPGARWSVYETDPEGLKLIKAEIFAQDRWKDVHFREIYCPHITSIRYFECPRKHTLLWGNRGGGKSVTLLWNAIFTANLIPGSSSLTMRRVIPELKKTLISELLKIPEGLRGRYNDNDKVSRVVIGSKRSEIWFAGAENEQDVRKMLSGNYDLIQFDEWAEWPFKMWDFITGSARSTYSQDIMEMAARARIGGATNPMGTGGTALQFLFGCDHVKQQVPGEDPTLYNPEQYEAIRSDIEDNPAFKAGTKAGDDYRQLLLGKSRRIQAAWIYARWDKFEGQYFENLNAELMTLRHDTFLRMVLRQHWAPRWMSIDWGMEHHAVCGWWALVKFGQYEIPVTYRAYICKGLGETGFAQELVDHTELNERKKIEKIYLSPDCFGDSNHSRARRMGNVFAENDMPRPVPAMNKREDGWSLMDDLMREVHEHIEVLPDVYLTVCGWMITDQKVEPIPEKGEWPTIIECLGQAVRNPKKDGDVMAEGDSLHLDVNDMARYGIASRISPRRKPLEDQIRDKLEGLPVEGNQRYMEHLKLLAKDRKGENSDVFYLKGFRGRRR